ncbi:MAG TPA: diadenylate cyclase CdaA [Prolixibacteraceae bacterium]|nr:diadenylate cyclase CdaA [Prolixibacteraceae bacterium]
MIAAFITIRFLDVVDILLVAFLIYELYMLIRGTAAFSILVGLFMFYLIWLVTKGLDMGLISGILGGVVGVGALAIVIVFQPEIRKMFLLLGNRYNLNRTLSLDNIFFREKDEAADLHIKDIIQACEAMSATKTGALIVLINKTELKEYEETGEMIDAPVSSALLQTIFFKNAPLHDGAVIIRKGRILAARCVLPVTDKEIENDQLGLRHRAAIGISQVTDAQVIVVSEETGRLAYVLNGNIHENVNPIELSRMVEYVYKNS